LELTAANRRAVLDDAALLSVRYLRMTANEFLSGPMPSGLLTAQETAVLMKHILDPKRPRWTRVQRLTGDTLEYMASPRLRGPDRRAGAGGLSYVIKRRSSSSSRGAACAAADDDGQPSDSDSPRRSSDKNKHAGGKNKHKKNKKKCMDSCFCNYLIYCLDVCFG